MAIKKITDLIVAVDFSSYSKVVVSQAQIFSEKLKIKLIYVFVFQNNVLLDRGFEITKDDVQKYYQTEVRRKYKLPDNANVIIRYGRPFEELIAVAAELKQPLIVAGHRGRNPISRFFLGSTAEKLALLSPYPTWIHRGQKALFPKKILVPCDLSAKSDHLITEVLGLSKSLQASYEFYHVMEEPMPILDFQAYAMVYTQNKLIDEQAIANFKKKYPALKIITDTGQVVENILERAKKFDAVAITPQSHRKSVPTFGSVTAKLIRGGDKSILILP